MSEQVLIRVVDWDTLYENNRTKDVKKTSWVPVRNTMDNSGYVELLDHVNGPSHFAVWIAILQIASRCKVRGVLSRDGRNHDPESLARISRIPQPVFEEAIPRLLSIGWISTDVVSNESDNKTAQIGTPRDARTRASVLFSSVLSSTSNTEEIEVYKSPENSFSSAESTVLEVCQRIHERHPKLRRCSLSEVQRSINSILSKHSARDRLPLLRKIDESHAAHCQTEKWIEDGGKYAKGLDNWLAPTMRRWEADPPESDQRRIPTKAERSLIDASNMFERME